MRRLFVFMATTSLLLSAGCGGKSYDIRLDKTLATMRYRKRLDDNLMPPAKGKLEQFLIYVRPPKNLQGPTKEFQLTALEPGTFEVSESFIEKNKQNMHVLARVKRPKDTSKKKAAPKPEDAVPRGDFSADVVAILNNVYGVELDLAKAKEERKKDINVFKHLTFEGNGKVVQLYLNVVKDAQHQVALIFEYPKSDAPPTSKIELCLESYATGLRATRAFSGAGIEEESGEPGAPAGAPQAF